MAPKKIVKTEGYKADEPVDEESQRLIEALLALDLGELEKSTSGSSTDSLEMVNARLLAQIDQLKKKQKVVGTELKTRDKVVSMSDMNVNVIVNHQNASYCSRLRLTATPPSDKFASRWWMPSTRF